MSVMRTEHQRKKDNERRKAKRQKRKQNHECTRCGKQDERTLEGFTLCVSCTERRNAAHRKWRKTEKGRLDNRTRGRRLRLGRVIRGVCAYCRKNPPEDDKAYCTDCLNMFKENNRKRKEKMKCST